ncbi:MAG: type methionyl aminopeptidase [Verrucomicrobiota bacterium]
MASRPAKPLSLDEIRKMERVCRMAAEVLQYASTLVKSGVSTMDLNDAIHDRTLSLGAQSAPLNYYGYPAAICTSVNDVVCHGVPRIDEILKDGDIINIDVTLKLDGFFGDTSATFFVGEVSDMAKRVTAAAREGMYAGIAQVKAGRRTGDIGYATQKVVRAAGFHCVEEIGGHGIGPAFHMEPFVPAVGMPNRGDLLIENSCLTVEPMVNQTGKRFRTLDIPGSEHKYYRTTDGTLSAQFEHTVLVTKKGHEILTAW